MKPLAMALPFLLASYAGSQAALATKAAQQACGPASVEYTRADRKAASSPVPPEIPATKAIVYIFEQFAPSAATCLGRCGALVRYGLDGHWEGALFGDSYLYTLLDPGVHHLCANWQTRIKARQLVSLASLDVQPGKTYYFGVKVRDEAGEQFGTFGFELEPINADEARLLLEKDPLGVEKPKP